VWQFVSSTSRLLPADKPPLHDLADDLEPFIHVPIWAALCYTSHRMTSQDLIVLPSIAGVFDESYLGTNDLRKGGHKSVVLVGNTLSSYAQFDYPVIAGVSPDLRESRTIVGATRRS
jgi:hypothetical protein